MKSISPKGGFGSWKIERRMCCQIAWKGKIFDVAVAVNPFVADKVDSCLHKTDNNMT